MSVEYSNKWYRETCIEAGLNPDNVLSDSEVQLARDTAKDIRKYQIAKENYLDPEVQKKLDKQIKRLNEQRIGHMFEALTFAEIVAGVGKGFDKFLEHQINRRKTLLGGR